MEWINKKTIIVTGASSGVGREIADVLIRQHGCNVIGIGRTKEKLEQFKQSLTYMKDRFTYYSFDVGQRSNWKAFARKLEEDGINVHILINCVAVLPIINKLDKFTDEQDSDCINSNYNSARYAVAEMLPLLRKTNMYGIMNVVGFGALIPFIGTSTYAASQAALLSYSKSMVGELGREMYVGYCVVGKSKTQLLRNQYDNKNKKLKKYFKKKPDIVARQIVNSIQKQKIRTIVGADAKRMNIFTKLFPTLSIKFYEVMIKHSKLDMFDNVKM